MATTIPTFEHSLITRDERGVYTLSLCDATSLNILGSAAIQGLAQAMQWLSAQADARAVVLRGNGERAFVAGADIREMAALKPAAARAFITRLRLLCDAVQACPVPTIARIPGYCLGGGMELAAACDIRIGSERASFGMPEVRVGIPSVIHASLLPGLIGAGAARWLLLTGASIDAAQALRWGFLQFVGAPEALDGLIEDTVAAIVASGPLAIRAQKGLLRDWETATPQHGMDNSVTAFADAFKTNEPATHMAPFLARKAPGNGRA